MLAPNETVQTLTRARNLIADEGRWCKEDLAQDDHGVSVWPTSAKAAAFCVNGALIAILGESHSRHEFSRLNRVMEKAARELGWSNHVGLNNGADHATVMACFDRAISLAASGE